MVALLLGSAVIGTLLLVLVFCIPVDKMRQNVAFSVDNIIKDDGYVSGNPVKDYIWKNKEGYTDAIMVQNAIEKIDGKSVFEHAMWMYHNDVDPEIWTPEESLRQFCHNNGEGLFFLHQYSRYWHGYLVYLKPLLLFFSWGQVMALGAVFMGLLTVLAVYLAVRVKKPGIVIAMLTGAFFMKVLLMFSSLTMAVCWIITLASMAWMMLRHEKLEKKKRYPEFFLMVGILTAYFDFLTFPVVTLGFPLCTYFLLQEKEGVKEAVQKVIGYSVCWGIGYAGMWGMKWVVADITLHTGTIKDALWSIIGRTESIGGRSRVNGGFYTIGLNLQEYDWTGYSIGAAILGMITLGIVVYAAYKLSIQKVVSELLPYMMIFCIPFVWIIVVQHHSALHARFTFRIIGVAAMAACSAAVHFVRELKAGKKKGLG